MRLFSLALAFTQSPVRLWRSFLRTAMASRTISPLLMLPELPSPNLPASRSSPAASILATLRSLRLSTA